jgi:hypothetical protein
MDLQMPDGRTVTIPDDINGEERYNIINSLLDKSAATGAQKLTNPQQLPPGMTMQPGPGVPTAEQEAIKESFNPVTAGSIGGGLAARYAVKAGAPLVKSGVYSLLSALGAAGTDYPISLGAEKLPEGWPQLAGSVAGGLAFGIGEEKLAQWGAKNIPALAKTLGRHIMQPDMVGKPITDINTGPAVRFDTVGEIIGGKNKPLRSIVEQSVENKSGKYDKQIADGWAEGDLGSNIQRGIITVKNPNPELDPLRYNSFRMGRYGAIKMKTGAWKMFESDAGTPGMEGFKYFPEIFTKSKNVVEALSLIRKRLYDDEPINVAGLIKGFHTSIKNIGAKGAPTKIGGPKVGKTDDVPTWLFNDIDPLRTAHKGVDSITPAELRSSVYKVWRDTPLVTEGKVVGEITDELRRADSMLDFVGTNPNSRSNIDQINDSINNALRDKKISLPQAELIRSLNKEANFPTTFSLLIKKIKGEDPPRAEYNIAERIIRLDPARQGPAVYSHEFGHWGFFDVLSSNERLEATQAIIDIVKRGEMKKFIPHADDYIGKDWNEVEIFAEMFSQHVLNHVLPSGLSQKIVATIARVINASQRVARAMLGKESTTPEMRKYFDKLVQAPTPDGKFDISKLADDLPPGSLATMPRNEALEMADSHGFVSANKMTGELELKDFTTMKSVDRIVYADWLRNAGELTLYPNQVKSMDDFLEASRMALESVVNPRYTDALMEEFDGDMVKIRELRAFANQVFDNLDRRVYLKNLTAPVAKSNEEAAVQVMKDNQGFVPRTILRKRDSMVNYGFNDPKGPWWMNPAVQLRLTPSIVGGMMGLEFGADDGWEVPGMNGWSVGYNWQRGATYAGAFGLISNKPGALLRQFSHKQTEKLWSKLESNTPLLHKIAVAFHNKQRMGDLHKTFKEYLNTKPRLERHWNQQIAELRKRFDHDELVALSDAIEKEGPNWQQVLKDNKADVEGIQGWVKDIRQSLIDSGIPKHMIDKLGDAYLPRIYNGKKQITKPLTTIKNSWNSLTADYLIPRGLTKTIDAKDEIFKSVTSPLGGIDNLKRDDKIYQYNLLGSNENHYIHQRERQLIAKMNNMKGYERVHTWQVDRNRGRDFTLRRDYTRLERDVLGEQRDAGLRMIKLAREAAHDVALGGTFKSLAAQSKHVMDPKDALAGLKRGSQEYRDAKRAIDINMEDKGWIEVKSTKTAGKYGTMKYGMLGGKYVSPEADRMLKSITSKRFESEGWRIAHKVVSNMWKPWKIAKTAYNPATHGYNWTANLFMSGFDGRNPANVLRHGFSSLIKKDEFYNEAIHAGILDSNLMRGELNLSNLMGDLDKLQLKGDARDGFSMFDWASKLFGGAKWVNNKVLRSYEIGDEVYKLGVFKQELRKGATPTDAMESANALFFDYRDIPPGIAAIRDWGIMPFVSYTYKAIPVIARTMVENPHRILGALAFIHTVNEVMYGLDYGKDAKKQQQYERENLPEYMKENKLYGAGPSGNIRVSKRMLSGAGIRTQEGIAPMIDIAHQMPLGDALGKGGMLQGYPFGFNPIVSMITGIAGGIDPHFMKALGNPNPVTGADKLDNIRKKMRFIGNVMLPNLPFIRTPGGYLSSYSYEKMGNALVSEGVIPPEEGDKLGFTGKNYFGGQVSAGKELFSMFGMLKSREPYPAEEHLARVKKAGGAIYKAQNKLKSGYIDQRSTDSELTAMENNLGKTMDTQVNVIDRMLDTQDQAPDPYLEKFVNTPSSE